MSIFSLPLLRRVVRTRLGIEPFIPIGCHVDSIPNRFGMRVSPCGSS